MFGEEIRDVREAARLMIARYPDAALKLATALVVDNRERGNDRRASIWAKVATEIEANTFRLKEN